MNLKKNSFAWDKTIHGDNLDIMRQLVKDKITFNLILTDPPYNIGKDFGNNTDKQKLEDFIEGVEERLELMQQLLSPRGSILWFCTHRFVGDLQLSLRKKFCQRRLMIWHYENGMSRQEKEPVTEYDPFWWFSASNDSWTYNKDDVRVPYKTDRVKNPVYKKDSKGNKIAWLPNPKGRKRGDLWKYPALSGKTFEDERTEHKTQKPMSLITDLIRAFCPKDTKGKFEGRIFDPYHGSGTMGVCCEHLNRIDDHKIRWSACELEKKWVDVADERVEHERGISTEQDLFA